MKPRGLPELVSGLSGKQATLHLRSGRDVSGVVTEILPGHSDQLVVLVRNDQSTYVPMATIEAVTVDGERPAPREEPPTRLAARRSVEEHARRISKALSIDIVMTAPFEETDAGEPMRALVERSNGAAAAIEAATRDEMGKSALASRVRRIVLSNDPSVKVTLDGDALTFGAHPCDLQASVEALF